MPVKWSDISSFPVFPVMAAIIWSCSGGGGGDSLDADADRVDISSEGMDFLDVFDSDPPPPDIPPDIPAESEAPDAPDADLPLEPPEDLPADEADDTVLPIELCETPEGNILAHGQFEEGMSGRAPTGWEVRSPGMPDSCPGSPDSHVYIGDPPTGCTGHSLVVDAEGTWDCYAIQTVSGYSTIEGGRTYRVSAAVRSMGNAVNPAAWFIVGVQWLDASDRFFGDEKNPATSSAEENDFDWKVLSFELSAPRDATRILVWLTAHYPGKVEYDNVAVVQLD
ncbi:MAG: hypothetical protein ABIJ56_10330 [Pseudomonadota bacterium]